MSWWRVVARRARYAPGVGAGFVGVVALVGVLLATVVVGGPTVLASGLAQRFAAGTPAQRAVEIAVPRDASAPQQQDETVREVLARAFGPVVPVVSTQRRGELLELPADPAGTRLVPWAGQEVPGHAVLTAGRWPSATTPGAPVEAALQADAAAAMGLHAGDTLVLRAAGGAGTVPPVVLVGLWRPRDPADAFWLAEPLELQGFERAGVRGPLLVADQVADRLPVVWTTLWRAVPDPAAVAPDRLEGLSTGLSGLRAAVGVVPSTGTAATVGGELPAFLSGLVGAQHAASGAASTLLGLLAAAGAGLCLLAGGLLAQQRSGEVTLLRVRGAGGWRRLGLGLREGLAAAVLAAPAAALLGVLVVQGQGVGARDVAYMVLASFGCALAGAVCVVGVVALRERAAERAARSERSAVDQGTTRRTILGVRPVTLVVALLAAAVAAWQLRAADVPVADDPVLVVSAVVVLWGGAVLAVPLVAVLVAPGARLAERAGPVRALAAWHLTRRATRPASAVAVVVLTAAAAVCVLTAEQVARDTAVEGAHQTVPAPVVVAVPVTPGGAPDADLADSRKATAALGALPGVAALSPVLSFVANAGEGRDVRVLALDTARLPQLTAGAVPVDVGPGDLGPVAQQVPAGNGDGTPALAQTALADAVAARPDTPLTLASPSGTGLRLQLARRRDRLPDDPFADAATRGLPVVLVDLANLQRADEGDQQPPRAVWQWWLVPSPGTDPRDLAARARAAVAPLAPRDAGPTVALTRAEAEQRALGDGITLGLARLDLVAVAGLTLAAVVALLLGQLAGLRRRRAELAVLRAVGLSQRQTTRLAIAETAALGALTVVAGLLVAYVVAPLTARQLTGLGARTDVAPAGLPAAAAGAVGIALVVATLLVAVVRARVAVRASLPACLREDLS